MIGKLLWKGSRIFSSAARIFWIRLHGKSLLSEIGPGTNVFGRVRFGSANGNIFVGRRCLLGHDIFLSASEGARIKIGDDSSLNSGCHVVAIKGISIGDGCRIGEYCSIRDQNHAFESDETPIFEQGFISSPINIGSDVWIGRGSFIGKGVTLGDGCIVGANSVVLNSFAAGSIIGGIPAKLIRMREKTSSSA